MTAESGAAITLWTARLAVGLYLGRLLLRAGRTANAPSSIEAAVWACAAAVFLAHVAAAFQFHHGWSHAAAYEHTARRTAAVTGFDWGGGIFLNDALTVWWPADAIAVGVAARRRRPFPNWYSRTTDLCFGFMILNATVVFGSRWWLAVAAAWLAAVLVIRNRRRRSVPVA
jgi:hypothetical protein